MTPPLLSKSPPAAQPLIEEIFEVHMSGHLDLPQLRRLLDPINDALARRPGRFRMVIDALGMESYDPIARDWWVREWSPQYRPRLERLAIVTDRTVWHMLAVTLGLATTLKIKPFRSVEEARDWLRSSD